MKKFFKALLTTLSLFVFTLIINANTAFASMGSSGGGGGGSAGGGGSTGGGAHGGGGGNGAYYSVNLGPVSYHPFSFINGVFAIVFSLMFTQLVVNALKLKDDDEHHYFLKVFMILFVVDWFVPFLGVLFLIGASIYGSTVKRNVPITNVDNTTYYSNPRLFLEPNITYHDLQHWMLVSNLSFDEQGNINEQTMIDNYVNAQDLYEDLLKQSLNHPFVNKRPLLKYLGFTYYRAMCKEICLKKRKHTYDDIRIEHIKLGSWMIHHGYCVAQLYVYGKDKEHQANYNDRVSFERDNWIDCVVYDKNYKIVNIIYGDHFHLDGTDFNDVGDTAERTVERNFEGNPLPTKRDVRKHENKEQP